MAQTMLSASKSNGVQCLSKSRVARQLHAMDRTKPFGCSCSSTAPKLFTNNERNYLQARRKTHSDAQARSVMVRI